MVISPVELVMERCPAMFRNRFGIAVPDKDERSVTLCSAAPGMAPPMRVNNPSFVNSEVKKLPT